MALARDTRADEGLTVVLLLAYVSPSPLRVGSGVAGPDRSVTAGAAHAAAATVTMPAIETDQGVFIVVSAALHGRVVIVVVLVVVRGWPVQRSPYLAHRRAPRRCRRHWRELGFGRRREYLREFRVVEPPGADCVHVEHGRPRRAGLARGQLDTDELGEPGELRLGKLGERLLIRRHGHVVG
jgi:hypothetical protein